MKDIVGCCSLERAPAAVDAALQCIIQMAAAPALQVVKPLLVAPFLSHSFSFFLISHFSFFFPILIAAFLFQPRLCASQLAAASAPSP